MPKWITWSEPEQCGLQRRVWCRVLKQLIKSVGYSEHHFEVSRFYKLLFDISAVGRVVLDLKLDAGNSLERSWAQVMQKALKMNYKWRPGGAFRSTLGLWRACSGGLMSSWLTFSRNFGVLEASFGRDFEKKYNFLIWAPLCSGIGGFGSPGVQVGAT